MTTMTQILAAKAKRAKENRAYVRMLLWQREPSWAAALALAERDFSCSCATSPGTCHSDHQARRKA